MSGERRTAKYTVAKPKTVKPRQVQVVARSTLNCAPHSNIAGAPMPRVIAFDTETELIARGAKYHRSWCSRSPS